MISFRKKKQSKVYPCLLFFGLVGSAVVMSEYEQVKEVKLPSPISKVSQSVDMTNKIKEVSNQTLSNNVSRGNDRKKKVVTAIDKHLKNRMAGKGEVIYRYARQQDPAVNPMLVAAVIIHELGKECSSPLFERTDNVAGINWTPDSPYDKDGRYNSYRRKGGIDQSISHLCRILSRYYIAQGQNTINLIGVKYAPLSDKDNGKHGMKNESWIPSVTQIYENILEAQNEN